MMEGRISSRSVGVFNPGDWITEGDGLLVSARLTRALWHVKRRAFSRTIKVATRPRHAGRRWSELTGLPRASLLLLGYSVEMFLKAGLARAYTGCPERMFDRDARSRFGHDLAELANEVDYPGIDGARAALKGLQAIVLSEARYPVAPVPGASYTDAVNERTNAMWSHERFRELCSLAKGIRQHITLIDRDSRDPATFQSVQIDKDGYLAFRIGGNLRPRITYRASSPLVQAGATSPDEIRRLFGKRDFQILLHYWDKSLIVEDGRSKTTVRQIP